MREAADATDEAQPLPRQKVEENRENPIDGDSRSTEEAQHDEQSPSYESAPDELYPLNPDEADENALIELFQMCNSVSSLFGSLRVPSIGMEDEAPLVPNSDSKRGSSSRETSGESGRQVKRVRFDCSQRIQDQMPLE